MALCLKDVNYHDNKTSVLIDDGKIIGIGDDLPMPINVEVKDCKGLALFPAFANLHTHAAMTLFRGYGDDYPLNEWLNNWIWPCEKRLDEECIYWATRFACVEMIKSGTTLFNDMYFYPQAAAKAVEQSGIRAVLGYTGFDFGNADAAELLKRNIIQWYDSLSHSPSGRIQYAIAPHAPYTVSDPTLVWMSGFASEHNLLYHIHMSETEKEIADSIKVHGTRPYRHLHDLGILEQCGHRFIGAHSLHLSKDEISLIGSSGANVVHNPNSNLKLGSGYRFFYTELRDAGANVALGTDGCSSSNNLDMLEATKTMALLQKGWRQNPTAMPAAEAFSVSTINGFRALNVDAGKIAVGKSADLILVNLDNLALVPANNILSNLIYAAHSDCIDTVICDGNIVMENRIVPDEQYIREEFNRVLTRVIVK